MAKNPSHSTEEEAGITPTADTVIGAWFQTRTEVTIAGYAVERIDAQQKVVQAATGFVNAATSLQEARARLQVATYQRQIIEGNPHLVASHIQQAGQIAPPAGIAPATAVPYESEKAAARRLIGAESDD